MLDLAISINQTATGTTLVLTNGDRKLATRGWPQDCEFQLVASSPAGKTCEVVNVHDLSHDLDQALRLIAETSFPHGRKPGWYHRLARYAHTK